MKLSTRLFSLATAGLIAAPLFAEAKTTLAVVTKYSQAADASWTLLPEGYIPSDLVNVIQIDNPSKAYQAPYKNIFFQNDRVVVCYLECNVDQPIEVSKRSDGSLAVPYNGSLLSFSKDRNNSILKVATVYYWLNKLMDDLAPLGFKPSKRLIVRIDREVAMPASGAKMENNAYFLDKDWSLTFLPAHLKFVLKVLTGGKKLSSPALDPSVAMHETMHSVFQQLIGSIINQEIMGLHEAFADYFALDILNDHRLGLIFSSGAPLRVNDKISKPYKVGMEAHDLGNIVASALWKIRGVVGNSAQAKKIVYATILELGRSPYISAGDVRRVHIAQARAAGLTDAKMQQIAAVWEETQLVSSSVDLSTLRVPEASAGLGGYTVTVSQQIPDAVTKQWAILSEGAARVSVRGSTREGGSLEGFWREIEIEGPSLAKQNVRLLISDVNRSILAAYTADGRLIGPQDAAFPALKMIGEKLPSVQAWEMGHGDMVGLAQGASNPFMKAENIQTQAATLTINGKKVSVQRVTFDVKPRFLGNVLGSLDSSLNEALRSLDAVALYTVSGDQYPTLGTTEVSPGRRLVGVSKRTVTGVVENSFLSDFDTENVVLEPVSIKGP